MRWLRQNLKGRFRRALRHPGYTAKSLLDDLLGVDERFLASLTNATPSAIRQFLNEPSGLPEFMQHMKGCEPPLLKSIHPGADFYAKKLLVQYAVTRALAPEVIVETGVANGMSSTHLLLACHLNGKGHVYSVDINRGEYLPPDKSIGWIVPEYLRARWTLMLGDARVLLPPLIEKLGRMDIFIHDSEHTYEYMKAEFELAYPHIRKGGLLIVDDATFNNAFEEFTRRVQPAPSRIIRGVGFIQKI